MAAGAGDFERALCGLLSANIFKIDREMLRLIQQRLLINRDRERAVSAVDEVDNIDKRFDRVHRDSADHGRFFGIDFGHNKARNFSSASFDRDG